ncbi:DUF2752 domain-containing protein [Thermodesulfobacteriota bacterium]
MRSNHISGDFFPTINKRTKSLVLLAGISGAAVVLYLFSPHESSIYASCPFRVLTHLHCPGCGTLRGLHELLHGNIGKAFGLNPLMVLLLPFMLFSSLKYIVAGITGRPQRKLFIPSIFIWTLLVIIISFGVLRNVPYYPFTLLAP